MNALVEGAVRLVLKQHGEGPPPAANQEPSTYRTSRQQEMSKYYTRINALSMRSLELLVLV